MRIEGSAGPTTGRMAFCILLLCLSGCVPLALRRSQPAVFRLFDSESGRPLSHAIVSVYDGHDRNFYWVPRVNNASYHFADIITSSEGHLVLDLAKFTDPFGEILLKSDGRYKYLEHKRGKVKVVTYRREGNSYRALAHHDYDLRRQLMTTWTIATDSVSEPKAFEVIQVPMDK